MDVATHHFHRWIARRMASARGDAPFDSLDDQAL
jgi:hypothetical protein